MDFSPRHKPLRLTGHDYAHAGTYAFTVVVRDRRCCLGSVEDFEFHAAPAGDVIREVWHRLPTRFPSILLDEFVVMPNHIHGIVLLGSNPLLVGDTTIPGSATEPAPPVAPPCLVVTPHENSPTETQTRILRPPSRDKTAPALGEIIRSLKAASATRIRKECLPDFEWQARYWDRIVRNDSELDRFRGYIATNPERWTLDREYSDQ